MNSTPQVDLRELVAVDDCGNVINPTVVESQVHGSVMLGVGESLLEAVVYDENGQLLTANLVSYLIPSATQHVPLTMRRLYRPAPSNPLGAKGTGETGCIGVPAAMLNAIHDALAPLGVTSIGFPLTPNRVWQAIRVAQIPRTNQRARELSSLETTAGPGVIGIGEVSSSTSNAWPVRESDASSTA